MKSPRKTASRRNVGESVETSSSVQGYSVSPYPPSRPPVLHVQTPSDSYQSAFSLTIPGPFMHSSYERDPSVVSTSTSSLAPSDSISMCHIPPPSRTTSRRSRHRVASFTSRAPSPDLPWSDARQMRFEERMIRLTASAGLPLSWVENPEWLNFCTEFIPQANIRNHACT
jgi:hypothetical protein